MPASRSFGTAVVVGAGPGGSVAAILLARSGWDVTVLERVAAPTAVGAGILLQPNGLAVLYGLGLRDTLRDRAHEIRSGAIRTHHGRVLLRTRVPDFGDGLDHLLALRRSHLATVVTDALADEPNVELRTGAEVLRASAAGDVTFGAGPDEQHLEADLVVAADGVRSPVRSTAGFAATLETTTHTYLRAIVASPDGDHDSDEQTEFWTPLGLFGSSPLGDGTTYFFADADAPRVRAAVDAGDLGALRTTWTSVLEECGPLFAGVATVDDLLVNRVQRVDAASFAHGRVALLGDAAHAMAPNLGQGANSALVDAGVLAQELADRREVGAVLESYDTRRRPAARKVQRDAERLGRAAGVRNGAARWLRDTVVSRTPPSATTRRFRAVQQEDPATLLRSLTRWTNGASGS